MKRKIKTLLAVFMVIAVLCTNASAAMLVLNGTVDDSVKYVTVLMTQKGADLQTLENGEIVWIEQADVLNGRFAIALPSVDEEYDLYSNVSDYEMSEGITFYISSNGDDGNDGKSQDKPIKTFEAIYSQLDLVKEIIILDSAVYTDAAQSFSHNITIKGLTGAETLTLPAAVSLKGDVAIDNIKLDGASTVYANGHKLEIGEGVTSTERLNVYGGASGASCESTDVRLYGGLYNTIYGGGNGGAVKGNTNVIIGGKVNPNDGIDDSASDISPTMVYGGGNNAAVHGSTNLTLTGDATVKYLVGAGTGSGGTAPETYINIHGGKVMNVYAGAQGTVLNGTNTHITMTGGTAEALFGGSESAAMTGNTYLTLKGGQVKRRVYTGCYNGYALSWSGDNYVKGTTTLSIYPEMGLNKTDGLSDSMNVGVFSGSRTKGSHSDEVNTVIYMNGCYSTQSEKMGDKSGWSLVFKSFVNYSVNAGQGGEVLGTDESGQIKVIPESGKAAVINGVRYLANQTAAISTGLTEVKFEGITSVDASRNDDGVTAAVGISSSVAGKLFAVVYDENKSIVSSEITDLAAADDTYTLNISCELKADTAYTIKLFLWDGFSKLIPLTREYSLVF